MSEKINKVPFHVHPDFRQLVIDIQTARIKKGKETSQTKIAFWKLTKTVTNMIRANPEMMHHLTEVAI